MWTDEESNLWFWMTTAGWLGCAGGRRSWSQLVAQTQEITDGYDHRARVVLEADSASRTPKRRAYDIRNGCAPTSSFRPGRGLIRQCVEVAQRARERGLRRLGHQRVGAPAHAPGDCRNRQTGDEKRRAEQGYRQTEGSNHHHVPDYRAEVRFIGRAAGSDADQTDCQHAHRSK